MPPAILNLDLHVRDITALLETHDLADVILVGHAYAGMVITGVAELAPERVAGLVYVNGVAPADGEAMVDQLEAVRGPEFVARIRGFIADGSPFMPPPTTAEEIAERWGITDWEDQSFMLPRLSPQPTLTFSQPVRTGRPEAARLRREFILCSESGFDLVAERAASSGWGVHHINTGHDPMITAPDQLSEILIEIVSGG
jgi:pimeloyl-ACP methyl ester carboxylesterase